MTDINQNEEVIPKSLLLICAIMLLASVAKLPYGYYTLLRIVTFCTFAYYAKISHSNSNNTSMVISIVIATLFNPIIPIYMDKSTWLFIDISVAMYAIFIAIKQNINESNASNNICLGLDKIPFISTKTGLDVFVFTALFSLTSILGLVYAANERGMPAKAKGFLVISVGILGICVVYALLQVIFPERFKYDWRHLWMKPNDVYGLQEQEKQLNEKNTPNNTL
jgi:hypothetical protein